MPRSDVLPSQLPFAVSVVVVLLSELHAASAAGAASRTAGSLAPIRMAAGQEFLALRRACPLQIGRDPAGLHLLRADRLSWMTRALLRNPCGRTVIGRTPRGASA